MKSADLNVGYYYTKPVNKLVAPVTSEKCLSIVVPISSLEYVDRLTLCIGSVRSQIGIDQSRIEIILVCLINKPIDMVKLYKLAREFSVKVLCCSLAYKTFPLSLARNIGARWAKHDMLCFIDADIVVDKEAIWRSLSQENAFVTIWASYQAAGYRPRRVDKDEIIAFRKAALAGVVTPRGYGGFFLTPVRLFDAIGGYDEVYCQGWGGEDNDIVDRAYAWGVEHGYNWCNLSDKEGILVLHQWHKTTNHAGEAGTKANRERYRTERSIVRNGGVYGDVYMYKLKQVSDSTTTAQCFSPQSHE